MCRRILIMSNNAQLGPNGWQSLMTRRSMLSRGVEYGAFAEAMVSQMDSARDSSRAKSTKALCISFNSSVLLRCNAGSKSWTSDHSFPQ